MQQSQEYYQSQVNNTLLAVERLQQDSSNEATVSSHSKQLRVVDERLEMLTINISSLSSAIDTNAIPVDLLAKSIDDINEKFESRTNILKSQVDELTIHTQVRVDELTDGLKKSRTKVRDLSETMKKISQIKQSIESVLSEVDSRAKQDASWTYEFKAGLQKLELKYGALEEQFEPLLENYLNTQSFASRMEELSRSYHEVMESMGGLKKDLLEEVHVSNSLTSKQLKETMQIKVDMVREEISTMHKQHSDRVDGRFQRISEVVID
jgi:methyl-accepting chemotaxis protein